MKTTLILIVATTAIMLTGCTTTVDHVVDTINGAFDTTPSNKTATNKGTSSETEIAVVAHTRYTVFNGRPPAAVILKQATGGSRSVTSYTIRITMPGYHGEDVTLKETADGWHVSAFLGLGGLIGWFVLDPANGGLYTLTPDQVGTASPKTLATVHQPSKNQLIFVMIQEVPKELRHKMTLVGYLRPDKHSSLDNIRK